MIKYTCPTCNTHIPPNNINQQNHLAKCNTCNIIFGLNTPLNAPNNHTPPPPTTTNKINQPPSIHIENQNQPLKITYKWRKTNKFRSKIIFAIIFNLISFFILVIAILILWQAKGDLSIALILLILIFVNLIMAYNTLIHLVNTTKITANTNTLTIQHGPLPQLEGNMFGSNKTLSLKDISQIYCVKKRTNTYPSNKKAIRPSYKLQAITTTNKKINLLISISNINEALYIEQELKRFLEIKDQSVAEEYTSQNQTDTQYPSPATIKHHLTTKQETTLIAEDLLITQASTIIYSPIQKTFAFISNLQCLPDWQTTVKTVKKTSTGQPKVGATYLYQLNITSKLKKTNGIKQSTIKITKYKPNQTIAYKHIIKGVPCRWESYTLKQIGNATKIIRQTEILKHKTLNLLLSKQSPPATKLYPLTPALIGLHQPVYKDRGKC